MQYVTFKHPDGRELCRYTVKGTFNGELQNTKELLAADFGIKPEDIIVAVEDSSRKTTGFDLTFKGKDHVDMPPCLFCKHRDKMTVSEPCYSCIDNTDIALHKPNAETEYASFEPISAAHAAVLQYEMNGGKQK